MKVAARVLLAVLVLVILLLGVAACSADALFYHPDQTVYGTPESLGLSAEEVHFRTLDGPLLHGWWVPATGNAKGTVVYCHGNHRNLTHHARFVAWFPRHGFHLLLFDYRGYGRSEGTPTRAGTVADTMAAIDFALARDPERTVVFGHSLGGAVAIVAVAQRPAVRALVVEATFPSYRAAACAALPILCPLACFLVSDGHDPEDALPRIPPRPLLVIHGTEDDIVPFRLGERLHALAGEPKEFFAFQAGGHMTPWVREGRAFEDRMCRFFENALR